jgi:hypothetical protein
MGGNTLSSVSNIDLMVDDVDTGDTYVSVISEFEVAVEEAPEPMI